MVSVAGPGALTSFGVGLRARDNVDPSITAAAVLRLHSGRVAEWQTRTVQVRVSERMWGFNSPLAHPLLLTGTLVPCSPPTRSVTSPVRV